MGRFRLIFLLPVARLFLPFFLRACKIGQIQDFVPVLVTIDDGTHAATRPRELDSVDEETELVCIHCATSRHGDATVNDRYRARDLSLHSI